MLTTDIAASSAERGILIIMAPEAGVSPLVPVAGLPLVRRIALAATRAGFARVLVQDARIDQAALPPGTAVLTAPPNGLLPPACRRVVLVPANVVPQTRWLAGLLETPLDAERAYVDDSGVVVVETDEPGVILNLAAGLGPAALRAQLRATFEEVSVPVDPAGRFALSSPTDVPRAETWLLKSLVKQSEGFMSRHVERPISLAVTRRLADAGITPNMMTLLSLAIGLSAAPFFLSGSPLWQLSGALLFLAHSVLDGCDGELARLKFLESRAGALLDFWGDNLVHVAFFASAAIGWSLAIGAAWPLALGAVAGASTLGAAAALSRKTIDDETPSAQAPRRSTLIEALAHRDFIYLVVLLAACGQAWWFLVAAAIGTPIFLALVLSLPRRRAR